MNSVELCAHIKGMPLAEALVAITAAGCTPRYVYHNGANLILNTTKDFVDNRINLRIERDLIKHARVG